MVLYEFATADIQPRIGGGHLTPVGFQFSNAAQLDKSLESSNLLVDEIEAGYYVVRSENDHSAIFVRRSIVTLAFYGVDHSPFDQKSGLVPK